MDRNFLNPPCPSFPPVPPPVSPMLGPLHQAATIDPATIQVGRFSIPPITIRVARLLERIDSPFVVPQLDPETGLPKAVIPSVTDVTNALYVIMNQRDPRLLQVLSNPEAFEISVLEMCGDISFAEMKLLSEAIQCSLTSVEKAAEAAGVEGSGEKKEDGLRTS